MDGLAEALIGLALLLGFSAAVIAFVRGFTNPITRVSDEMLVARPLAETESILVQVLDTARRMDVRMVAPATYELSYRFFPPWTIALTVIVFPLGVLALIFAHENLALSVALTGEADTTRVRVVGRMHKKVAAEIGAALSVSLKTA